MFDFVTSMLSFYDVKNIYHYLMLLFFLMFLITPVWALYLSYFKIEEIRNGLRRSWQIINLEGVLVGTL